MDIGTVKHLPAQHKDMRPNSDHETRKTPEKPEKINFKEAKQATEAMVVQQLINVDMGSISKSQELLFRQVIEKLDKILAPTQGENATQKAADAGIDFSPKATAQRITSHASGLIARFQAQNHLEPADPKIAKFIDSIQQAIERGFEDARNILKGFDVFKGGVESTFDATLSQALQNMDAIRSELGLEPANVAEPTKSDAPKEPQQQHPE